MRLAFVSTMAGSTWGGSEELWSQAALRLNDSSHDVMACVAAWPELSPRVIALQQRGIELRTHSSIRHRGLASQLLYKFTSGRAKEFGDVAKFRPDLVVVSEGYNVEGRECMAFCQAAGLPFVVILQCNSETWWPKDQADRGLADAYRAARKVYCVSQNNLDLLERQLGEALPNGVVVRNPYNVSPDQQCSWPADDGMWRLACVGRLNPSAKGQDLLFQIMARPEWRNRPVELNLYGSGPSESYLRRLADHLQLKSVRFCGYKESIAEIWEHNHLLLQPSRFEGLPISLVEAMWCGRAAVVTDVGGNAELCVDGETGFVAAAPTVELLERTIGAAWERRHDWAKMGAAARSRVERLISRDPVGDFCQLVLSAAGGK